MRSFVVVFFCLFLVYGILSELLRSMEEKEKERVYFAVEKKSGNTILAGYNFLSHFILSRYLVRKIKRRMDLYTVGNEHRAKKLTVSLCAIIMLALFFDVLIIIFLPVDAFVGILLSFEVYFVYRGMSAYLGEKEERRFTKHFLELLLRIKAVYRSVQTVEDSIEKCLEEPIPEEMHIQLEFLQNVLSKEKNVEELQEELSKISNVNLKEFMMLCITVSTFGDQEDEGKSLFLMGMDHLIQNVREELLQRKKQSHLFGGYSFIIAAPGFFLPFIQAWAKNTMPELSVYYDGWYGQIFVVGILFLIGVLFHLNLGLQLWNVVPIQEKGFCYYLSMQKRISAFLRKIADWELWIGRKRRDLLRKGGFKDRGGWKDAEKETILKQMGASFLFALFGVSILWNMENIWLSEKIVIIAVLLLAGYEMPLLVLRFQIQLSKRAKNREVLQFQRLFYFLSKNPEIAPEEILMWLYDFSYLFREKLLSAANALLSGEEEVLNFLIEEEDNQEFRHILERIRLSDCIGLKEAFSGMDKEQEYFQRSLLQEDDRKLEDKGAIGSAIAAIPLFAVIVGYLFLPFILESFSLFSMQLKDFSSSLF